MGGLQTESSAIGNKKEYREQKLPAPKAICVFYDGSYAVFFYACASLFYDAFFFYHTAYVLIIFIDEYNYLLKSFIRFSTSSRNPGTLLSGKLF
jgi:hypothetical protein